MSAYELLRPPVWAGYWQLDGLHLPCAQRPCWLRRTCMRLLLGIHWVDAS